MTLQVQHSVADWYLAFDDLWELMHVNWHNHNPFTQSGMWDAGDYRVLGISLVVDTPPYRGVLLTTTSATDDSEADYLLVVTYGAKCPECGYTPFNALSYGDDDPDEAIKWAASTITQMFDNARDGGVERQHNDECSHLRYDQEYPNEDDD